VVLLAGPIDAVTPAAAVEGGVGDQNATVGTVAAGEGQTSSGAGSATNHSQPPEPYASEILWSPPETGATGPIFLPKKVLEETPFEDWPVEARDVDGLRHLLRRPQASKGRSHRRRARETVGCRVAGGPLPEGSLPDASTLEEQISERRDLTFVGSVVATVIGLDVPQEAVRPMVYVEVQEVLRDMRKRVLPGDVLSFELGGGGRIEVDAGVLCTLPAPSALRVSQGDQLLVSADYINHFKTYLASLIVAPIRAGVVYPPQNGLLIESSPRQLDELRQAVLGGPGSDR
jgi:hypothetical protein